MNINDYKKYTIFTINNYPLKYRHYLRSLFLDNGIAQESGQISLTNPESIDISAFSNIDEQLKTCIEANDKSLAVFERWEYTKDYKYSALFSTDDFSRLCCEVEKIFRNLAMTNYRSLIICPALVISNRMSLLF